MQRIEREIAAIFKTIEEKLLQIQNDYRESKRNVEKIEGLIVKETHENECEKESDETKEVEENEEKKEKRKENFAKFRPTITLVPSSKLVCVVNCWDYFNIFQSPNLSSLSHQGIQVNEEEFPHQIEKNYEPWKFEFVQESHEKSFQLHPLPCYAGLDLRTNPFEEGENDEIKNALSMWKETYKK